MKRRRQYLNHADKLLLAGKRNINRATNIVLVILWVGTAAMLTFMILRWKGLQHSSWPGKQTSAKEVLIDDMLLSSGDLSLSGETSLINITLNNASGGPASANGLAPQKSEASRNAVYNNILRQKLKKAKEKPTGDFAIKPLPE